MNQSDHQSLNCSMVRVRPAFLVVSLLLLLSTILSIALNSFLFYLLSKTQFFHSNVRLILKNFSLAACAFSTCMFGRSMYNFDVWQRGLRAETPFACALTEFPWFACGVTVTQSIFFVGVERVYTTIWKRRFEDGGHPTTIARTMGVGAWGAGVLFGTLVVLATMGEDGRSLCYCNAEYALPIYAQLLISLSVVILEVIMIACFLFLYRHSRAAFLSFNLATTEHSLAQRHQLMANMETTMCVAPIMLIHGMIYIVVLAAYMYLRLLGENEHSSTAAVSVSLVLGVEGCVHPIVLLIKNKKLRRAAWDLIPSALRKLLSKNRVDPTAIDGDQQQQQKVSDNSSVGGGHRQKPITRKEAVAIAKARMEGKNVISTGLVEFRVKPEDNDGILRSLWETRVRHPK